MHGEGVFTWPDGKRYEGWYLVDKKHGYGELQWPDKRIFKGQWSHGKQDGFGKYEHPILGEDGGVKKVHSMYGKWEKGKMVEITH